MTREELEQIAGLDFSEPANVEIAKAAVIGGRDSLEWAMGVLAEADAECERIHLAAEEAIRRVREREGVLTRRVDQRAQFLRFAVEGYARAHRKEMIPGRAKTASLIHGEIAYRTIPERVEVEDTALALEWCQSQPVESDLVRIKYEINKRALADFAKRTNEIPPGCAVHPASESIVIRPEQPEALNIAPSRTKEIA